MHPQPTLVRRQVASGGVTGPRIVDEKALDRIGLIPCRRNVGAHTGDRHRMGSIVEDTTSGHAVVSNRVGDRTIRGIKGTNVIGRERVNALAAHIGIVEDVQRYLLSINTGSGPPRLKRIEVRQWIARVGPGDWREGPSAVRKVIDRKLRTIS